MPILYEQIFGKSEEKTVSAAKYPVEVRMWLGPEDPYAPRWPPTGITVKVGTKIIIRIGLRSLEENKYINSQGVGVRCYHRINTGAWEQIFSTSWPADDTTDQPYVLNKPGLHTFYVEWPGTDKYTGCSKAVQLFAR